MKVQSEAQSVAKSDAGRIFHHGGFRPNAVSGALKSSTLAGNTTFLHFFSCEDYIRRIRLEITILFMTECITDVCPSLIQSNHISKSSSRYKYLTKNSNLIVNMFLNPNQSKKYQD